MKRTTLVALLIAGLGCDAAPFSSPLEEQAAGPLLAGPSTSELPAIVARVNGEPIERWEIESALKEIEMLAVHPIPPQQRDGVVRNVLNRIVGHYLVAQEARTHKLNVSSSEVDADISQLQMEYADPAAFTRMLAYFGMSMEQLRRQRHLRLQVAEFVRLNIRPVAISKGDVEAYYRQNLKQFEDPEMVLASQILVSAPTSSSDEKAAARVKAAGILDQLRRGADFSELARAQSDDHVSAAAGGSLGQLRRGDMDPALEAAAFALKPGALSELVETSLGYHIIKTHEFQPARTRPFAEVRDEIGQLLTDRSQEERLNPVVERLKAKATIEIYL